MPPALLRACAHPGCGAIQAGSYCEAHTRPREQGLRRANFTVRRWYRTARWARLRGLVLQAQPWCVECLAAGRPIADATDVDHKVPHRGSAALFWDRANLQGLCRSCHSRKTQRGE